MGRGSGREGVLAQRNASSRRGIAPSRKVMARRVSVVIVVWAVVAAMVAGECRVLENMVAPDSNPNSACKFHLEFCKCRCQDLESPVPCSERCQDKYERCYHMEDAPPATDAMKNRIKAMLRKE